MTTKTEKKKSEYATGWGAEEKPAVGGEFIDSLASAQDTASLSNVPAPPPGSVADTVAKVQAKIDSKKATDDAFQGYMDAKKEADSGGFQGYLEKEWGATVGPTAPPKSSWAEVASMKPPKAPAAAAASLDPHNVAPKTMQTAVANAQPAAPPPPAPMPDLPHESPPMPTLAKVGILVFLSGLGYVIYDFLKGKK